MEESPLRGRLEEVRFPELLLAISHRKETGILSVNWNRIVKDIFFHEGRIVFAKSNDLDERLGELLLRRGKITYRHLNEASAKVVPGTRLGTILVQEGFLKAADLYQGVIDQVEEIVYSIFEWSDGFFEFHSGELEKEVITLNISTPDIITAGVARIWRWSWISKGVGPLDTVYSRSRDWNAIAKKMLITPAIQSLIDLLERPMKLSDILQVSRINSYETCKLIWALVSAGVLEEPQRVEMFMEPEVTADLFTDSAMAIEPPPTEEINWRKGAWSTTPKMPVSELQTPDSVENATTGNIPAPVPIPAPALAPALAPAAAVQETSFSDLNTLTDQQVQSASPDAVLETPAEPPVRNAEDDVKKFNEVQRYLFEMLRIEMGAGVANFLTKILKKAAGKFPLVFEGVRTNEFGELDTAALTGSIQGNLVENYDEAFAYLLNEERIGIASFLDAKRVHSIEAGLQRILDKQK